MFFWSRPSSAAIAAFLERARKTDLSYRPVGIAGGAPAGFAIDSARGLLGNGEGTFSIACRELDRWRMFDLGWVELHPEGASTEPGTTVVVLAHHLGFWSLNGCRVVYPSTGSPQTHGFAYGTLADHAEQGEEVFSVSMDGAGQVWYEIRAVSRPRSALARIGYPVSRLLQRRFRRDSVRAMVRSCVGAGGTMEAAASLEESEQ
jgi:uncharacterized protein (UPF0548 family)